MAAARSSSPLQNTTPLITGSAGPPLPFPFPLQALPQSAGPSGATPMPAGVVSPPFLLSPASVFSTNMAAIASLSLASLSPSDLVFKARLALQAERFEEMAYFMRVLALQKATPLSAEERALFALAYKKLLAARRMGWRYIYSIEMKEKAASRKVEAEIVRETEREAREQRERDQQAAKAKEEEQKEKSRGEDSPRLTEASDSSATAAGDAVPKLTKTPSSSSTTAAATVASTSVPAPSVIPALQTRLASLTSNLTHIHSYRYQLFYESSLLISEVSSLLLERLIPKLLHNQSEDFFLKLMPAIIDQCVAWERKRSGRNKQTQQTKNTPPASAPSSDKTTAASDNASAATPLLASTLPLVGLSSATSSSLASALLAPPLSKLDTSRSWSLEAEFELQLRALDDRTRFLSNLRGVHAESLVFYCKMLADHRRLLAEFLAERDYEESERAHQSLQALAYYVLARFVSQTTLSPSHPVRLGLHLNFAVFYYEVLAKPDRACQMASQSYDLALNEWQIRQAQAQAAPTTTMANGPTTGQANASNTGGAAVGANASATTSGDAHAASGPGGVAGTYKDSLLIMQLLKNNLTMWAQSL